MSNMQGSSQAILQKRRDLTLDIRPAQSSPSAARRLWHSLCCLILCTSALIQAASPLENNQKDLDQKSKGGILGENRAGGIPCPSPFELAGSRCLPHGSPLSSIGIAGLAQAPIFTVPADKASPRTVAPSVPLPKMRWRLMSPGTYTALHCTTYKTHRRTHPLAVGRCSYWILYRLC